MAIIREAVESLKSSLAQALDPEHIIAACHEARHRWRDRKLNPISTIWLFALQILHENTACAHVARLLIDDQVSDSAYCQARTRIPLRVFVTLFKRVCLALQARERPLSWFGRRVLLVDGSSVSMSDTDELDQEFGRPSGQKKGCSFPSMHLLCLFEAGTGLMLDLVANPLRTHDAKAVRGVHRHLRRGDILVADRAFGSFAHLALLVQRGVDGLFRKHQKRKTSFRHGRVLGINDRVISIPKPRQKPSWMKQSEYEELPEKLEVRIIKFRVEEDGSRTLEVELMTTLTDPEKYPKEELAKLYLGRWQIEVDFRHLKQTLGMDTLKCKTVDGVLKELYMFGIVYNLVRVTMLRAAVRQNVPPDRISFIDVLRWLAECRPGDSMPRFKVNPWRPGRHRPRVVKRRPKGYSSMQPHHVAQIREARAC